MGAFGPAQRPSRRALVVRATAATEEKVEAKAEAARAEREAKAAGFRFQVCYWSLRKGHRAARRFL